MQWLQSLDAALFHLVNGSMGNPVFDWLMPIVSGGHGALRWFGLVVAGLFTLAMVRGGARARICALILVIVVAAGDPLVIGSIKNAVARPRPCVALSDVVERLGCSDSGSMPSAHSANWFAAATVMFLFYRRSGWLLYPMAALVAFSRVYCGVHYPGDVAAGAILGAGYAICLVQLTQMVWDWVGRRVFPRWHERLPCLITPTASPTSNQTAVASSAVEAGVASTEIEWLRLGYLFILLALVARWIYLASGLIGLSEDEAYQWLWSKHLALAYFSKPPGIALIQRLGTLIGGDTEFGVRLFSPLITSALSLMVLRLLAKEVGARTAFWVIMATLATPLLVAGSVLMTVDPPLSLCWMWAVLAGWRAVQKEGRTGDWVEVGLAMGLGLLFKQSAIYQVVCWAIYFWLRPEARGHLRKAGPWLALLIFSLGALPSLIWNAQHGWATLGHLRDNAGLNLPWQASLEHCRDFILAEMGLLNPVFLLGAIWAAGAIWQRRRENSLACFLFCMSIPVLAGHLLYSLHSRILPNWIAPTVAPLFCLAGIYWHGRQKLAKALLLAGLVPGLFVSAFMYDTDLLGKVLVKLPGDVDPSHRVRGWRETTQVVEQTRERFDPGAFIIADRYGTAGLFSFYSAGARAAAKTAEPLVYCLNADHPVNQFYFWPEYHYLDTRRGENAIFVRRIEPYTIEPGWVWKWLTHQDFDYVNIPPLTTAPPAILEHFETVTNLGRFEIKMRDGRVFQRMEIFGCYHLR